LPGNPAARRIPISLFPGEAVVVEAPAMAIDRGWKSGAKS
jgi:hypothetical protein